MLSWIVCGSSRGKYLNPALWRKNNLDLRVDHSQSQYVEWWTLSLTREDNFERVLIEKVGLANKFLTDKALT